MNSLSSVGCTSKSLKSKSSEDKKDEGKTGLISRLNESVKCYNHSVLPVLQAVCPISDFIAGQSERTIHRGELLYAQKS